MQVHQTERVDIAMVTWAERREDAERIFAATEERLRASGAHIRGRFFEVTPARLEGMLLSSAECLGLALRRG